MTDTEVLHTYLTCRGIHMSLPYLDKLLGSHPDFPTLISFADTLESLGIDSYAAKLEKDNFHEMDYPFLAVTPERANIFEIVYTEEQLKNSKNIRQAWNGMALFVEDGAQIKDPDYTTSVSGKQKTAVAGWVYQALLCLLLLAFIGYSTDMELVLFALFSLTGLVLSLSLVQHQQGIDNGLYKALCKVPQSIKCNMVLNSGLSSFRKIALTDLSLVYFLTVTLYTLLVSLSSPGQGILLLGIPVSVAVVFTLVLSAYQQLILETWCRICLAVTGAIWLQAIGLILLYTNRSANGQLQLTDFLLFVLALLIAACWFFLKPYLLATAKLKQAETALLKWKRDPIVFFMLLKQQMKIEYEKNTQTDIFFGDPNSNIQLVLVLKPFCTVCASAFNAIDKLFDNLAVDTGVTIRFAVHAARMDDRRTVAVRHIVHACKQGEHQQILREWFKEMDLSTWEARYPYSPGDSKEAPEAKAGQANQYFHHMDTPTLFINQYKLPMQYEIGDLKLLIPHFP